MAEEVDAYNVFPKANFTTHLCGLSRWLIETCSWTGAKRLAAFFTK